MEKLQIFIDNYPKSNYLSEANSYIKELQVKLEKKDFEVSKQYYTIVFSIPVNYITPKCIKRSKYGYIQKMDSIRNRIH